MIKKMPKMTPGRFWSWVFTSCGKLSAMMERGKMSLDHLEPLWLVIQAIINKAPINITVYEGHQRFVSSRNNLGNCAQVNLSVPAGINAKKSLLSSHPIRYRFSMHHDLLLSHVLNEDISGFNIDLRLIEVPNRWISQESILHELGQEGVFHSPQELICTMIHLVSLDANKATEATFSLPETGSLDAYVYLEEQGYFLVSFHRNNDGSWEGFVVARLSKGHGSSYDRHILCPCVG